MLHDVISEGVTLAFGQERHQFLHTNPQCNAGQSLLDGRQYANAFIDDVLGDALELVRVELHHVFILDVVRLVDKFADHVIIMFDVENTKKLDFLVADVRGREFGADGVHVVHLGDQRIVIEPG